MRTTRQAYLIALLALGLLGTGTATVAARQARRATRTPPYLEMYIQQGQKTYRLERSDLTFRTILTLGPESSGYYGLPALPRLRVDIKSLSILIFDPEGAGATLRLDRLHFIQRAPAHRFDIRTTPVAPAYFPAVYHVAYNAEVPVSLWCVGENIPLHITPVAHKPGWFRAVPTQPLTAGNYALNMGCLAGPRVYTGKMDFYPFVMAAAPPPKPKRVICRARIKRRPVKRPPVAFCPPAKARPAPPRALAKPMMAAGLSYAEVSPAGRREYQITNLNAVPWHNVNISLYVRDSSFPKTVLGPVRLYKNIVLPQHTVNQPPDKTFLQYATLSDAGDTIYLKIKCKEGIIKKAWKNLGPPEPGAPNTLIPTTWDLKH
jgi:hypothetical protein